MISGPTASAAAATGTALFRRNIHKGQKEQLLSNPRLHILGAGSIGLLWASSIRSAIPDYPVTLLLRDHHRKRLNHHRYQQQQGTKGNKNNTTSSKTY